MARDVFEDKNFHISKTEKVDNTVPSPCIDICMYDDTETYCIGCYRTPDEIKDWWISTKEKKLEVLEKIKDRKKG